MPRLLWLAFERPPHPDAVCHPATADEVQLVLEFLAGSVTQRRQRAEQLRNYLAQQAALPPWSRPAVPCRRATGLYVLVPWRLAKWLATVLPATDGLLERTRGRLQRWLQTGDARVVNATSSS
jgi:hypothetical protein